MGTSKKRPRRVGLFVEGVNTLTVRGRDELRELWHHKCEKLSAISHELIDVHGFSKLQLVLMDPTQRKLAAGGKVPLDVVVEQKHRAKPFDVLIVAFDALPANQAVRVADAPCLLHEKDFVLDHFANSTLLPASFRAAATALKAHYQGHRSTPRAAARPPLGDLELIYMSPMFETVVLQDEAALRRLFQLKRAPNDWPALPYDQDRPDMALRAIVKAYRKRGPNHLRVDYDAAKHAWALEILRNAEPTSPIWAHEVVQRLQKTLVAGAT